MSENNRLEIRDLEKHALNEPRGRGWVIVIV